MMEKHFGFEITCRNCGRVIVITQDTISDDNDDIEISSYETGERVFKESNAIYCCCGNNTENVRLG